MKLALIGRSMISPFGEAMRPRMPASWRICLNEPRAPELAIMYTGLRRRKFFSMASATSSVASVHCSVTRSRRSESVRLRRCTPPGYPGPCPRSPGKDLLLVGRHHDVVLGDGDAGDARVLEAHVLEDVEQRGDRDGAVVLDQVADERRHLVLGEDLVLELVIVLAQRAFGPGLHQSSPKYSSSEATTAELKNPRPTVVSTRLPSSGRARDPGCRSASQRRHLGMMIDLTNLNRVISIDAKAHKAVVQPIISNREIQARLNAQNLSYPSGHCPQVKLSGYLLCGGMSWNQGVWGTGIGSVEAVELVTPNGDIITADKDQNTDYYWAARGAGPGFFGVATRYHLKLYDLPKAIACSSYYYPIGEVGTVAQWLESIAGRLPPNIELSLFLLTAPPELAEKRKEDAGKVCVVTATIFADSREEVKTSLKPLDDCPIISKCLSKTVAKPYNFEAMFDASGALWPADHRNQVEAIFSNSKLADIFTALRDHFLKTPSPTTLIMFAIFTGPNIPATLPDAAFSMSARYYGGPWTMWTKRRRRSRHTMAQEVPGAA